MTGNDWDLKLGLESLESLELHTNCWGLFDPALAGNRSLDGAGFLHAGIGVELDPEKNTLTVRCQGD